MMIQPALSYGVTDPEANKLLAEKIILAKGNDKYITDICSEDFIKDPTVHLIKQMIKRGVGRGAYSDNARAYIIGQIPGFIEKVSSPEYLTAFAADYFKSNADSEKIMEVFKKSLKNATFLANMEYAVDTFKKCKGEFFEAEKLLRTPLTIFGQSEKLKEYEFPQSSCQETARRNPK